MDDSKFPLNFGMSILASNYNQIKSQCEEREPAAWIEVLFSGTETGRIGTMVFSSYELWTSAKFYYMTIK